MLSKSSLTKCPPHRPCGRWEGGLRDPPTDIVWCSTSFYDKLNHLLKQYNKSPLSYQCWSTHIWPTRQTKGEYVIRTANMWLELTFCQFFFNKETRKLTLICTFWKICFSSISQFPTATPMQSTFFNWNFTVALISLTLDSSDSWWVTRVGNFPELAYKKP